MTDSGRWFGVGGCVGEGIRLRDGSTDGGGSALIKSVALIYGSGTPMKIYFRHSSGKPLEYVSAEPMGGCWMFHDGCLHHIFLNHILQAIYVQEDFKANKIEETITI